MERHPVIVHIMYNRPSVAGKAEAEQLAKRIKDEFDSEPRPLIVGTRSSGTTGGSDRVWVEAAINFPGSNYAEATALVSELKEIGVEARTYHDND